MKSVLIYSTLEGTTLVVGPFDEETIAMEHHENHATDNIFLGVAPLVSGVPDLPLPTP